MGLIPTNEAFKKIVTNNINDDIVQLIRGSDKTVLLWVDALGNIQGQWAIAHGSGGGGSTVPGGSNTNVQVNDSGAFYGDNNFTWNKTTKVLTIAGALTLAGATSGSATIGVAAVAGSPRTILLPTGNSTANQVQISDGGNPQQLSWANAILGVTSTPAGGVGQLAYSQGVQTLSGSNNICWDYSDKQLLIGAFAPPNSTSGQLAVSLTQDLHAAVTSPYMGRMALESNINATYSIATPIPAVAGLFATYLSSIPASGVCQGSQNLSSYVNCSAATAGTITGLVALWTQVNITGGAHVTNAAGFWHQAPINNGVSGATLANSYGVYIETLWSQVALQPTFGAGIYVADQGNASGAWAYYSAGTTPSSFGGSVNSGVGFQVANVAPSGNVLRGNGTNFVSATLAASDLSNGTTGTGAVALAVSPAFTGTPTAPTPLTADNSTTIATTAYVQAQVFAAGSVSSVFGRTGAIVAVSGDYSFSQISGFTLLGDLLYGGVAAAPTILHGNTTTTKKYFSQTGTGSVSAAPAWAQIAVADLSDGTTGTGSIVLSASPTLTGTPVATTASTADNSTRVATTAFVKAQAYLTSLPAPTAVSLTPAVPGNFTVAHGLGSTPKAAIIQMTSGGSIYYQAARYDATNLFLVASDAGITGTILLWA